MKIAHVITRMIIGGAQENTLLNCMDLIRHHGDEVLLICGPSLGPEGSLLDQAGVRWQSERSAGQLRAAGQARAASQSRAGRLPLGPGPVARSRTVDPLEQASAGAEPAGGAAELSVCMIDALRRNIHPLHDAVATRQLRRILRAFQPDVVHTHSAKGGLLGRHVAWGLSVPAVIHTVHGAPFHAYQSRAAKHFFIACERWAARRCHRLISVADAMTDLMVDAGVAPREKFTTISSGMDVRPFAEADEHRRRVRERFGIQDHHVVVGKIARLFHLKGHADLVAAASEVVPRHPHVRFLLVGDGVLRLALQADIDARGLREHFIFTGLVPPSEVPAMIGAMDVLVHTSYREGLARALPQALIAGRPVISYDIDGAREVVLHDETGFLVAAGDLAVLASRIGQLVGDPSLRQRLGRQGQGQFTEQFRHEHMTAAIRHLYQSTLNSTATK